MKTIVSVQEIEELEVKPPAEVAMWRKLVVTAMEKQSAEGRGWVTSRCPCCDTDENRAAFRRSGVDYVECTDCGTLYARRRPGEAALIDWHRDSEPARFWRERLLKASEAARREKIVIPRAQWITDGRAEYAPDGTHVVDVSANSRPLIEEILAAAPDLRITVASQTAETGGEALAGLTVAPTAVAALPSLGEADFVTALDAFDRAPDLRALVAAIHETLRPGGIVFATLPVASGFEVQALWDRSPTVLPPDKVNLPTIAGLMRLFAAPDWELLELSTTGMFDVELVRRTIEHSPEADWPRAVRALVANADEGARRAFTEYLQSQRLTSFARLVARRTN